MPAAASTTSADVAGIVLAAGAGRRFGGAKQLALLDGRPLLAHVIEQARSVAGLNPLIVVLGAHSEPIRAAIDFTGVQIAQCQEWAEGQSASLRAGVAALGDVNAAVVLLGDTPYVTAQVIAGAIDRLSDGYDAVRTLHHGTPSHPVVLGRRALAGVPALRGDVGARELLRTLRVREWEAGHLYDARDIDTPEQLR